MKAQIFIMSIFLALGCRGQMYIEPGKGLGKYVVGATVTDNEQFPKGLDIRKEDNTVVAILFSDTKYKTKEGLCIGSSFDEVKKHFGHREISELPFYKGGRHVGTMGQGLLYEGIGFIDLTQDGIVDLIIIE